MKTLSAKAAELDEKWYLVDAQGQVLGRLATRIAILLRGKHLGNFTPHMNMKTHVVVINAGEVVLTGDKWRTKMYRHHTGWPGGLKEASATEVLAKKPTELLRSAVNGMLPKNRMRDDAMTRLRIFAGAEHRHKAQQPEPLDLKMRAARKVE